MQRSEIKWVHVDDALPEIPKEKFGIHVLAVFYDPLYDEENEDRCWYVSDCSYARVTDNKHYINSLLKFDFVDMYSGYGESWGPTGDKVVYWSYMPELPDFPVITKLK